LLYNPNVPVSRTAERRLKAIFESTELGAGFQIALKDLEIRGAGTILGSAQHGHLVAVGFDLYCSLLAEAVNEKRGISASAQPERKVPTINLQVDAYIPPEYVEDENQRLRLYQRLAGFTAVDSVNDLAAEMRDRFGPLPEPVKATLAMVRIRIKAEALHMSSITVDPMWLVMRGSIDTVYDRVALYSRFGMAARIDHGNLRVPIARVLPNVVDAAEEILDRGLVVSGTPANGRIQTPPRQDERRPVTAQRGFPR
jgi:transcription-repair coupling factor (superfamily II helicase)